MSTYRMLVTARIESGQVLVTYRKPGSKRWTTRRAPLNRKADYPIEQGISDVFKLGEWGTRGGTIYEQPTTTFADGSELQRVTYSPDGDDDGRSAATYALELTPLAAALRAAL